MLNRILPVVLLATLATACSQAPVLTPVTPAATPAGSTPGPNATVSAFSPSSVSLTVDAQPYTISADSRLDNASQADGYIAQMGRGGIDALADNAAGVTISLTQLTKSPTMPSFTGADAGRKIITLVLSKGATTGTYQGSASDSIQVTSNGGKLDISYAGASTLISGGSNFKSNVNLAFKATGLPTSR